MIRSIRNQCLGINAHLHSLWQGEGGWSDFHNRHISDLTGLLRQKLLPMGYTAHAEDSLQIRRKVPYRAVAIKIRGGDCQL